MATLTTLPESITPAANVFVEPSTKLLVSRSFSDISDFADPTALEDEGINQIQHLHVNMKSQQSWGTFENPSSNRTTTSSSSEASPTSNTDCNFGVDPKMVKSSAKLLKEECIYTTTEGEVAGLLTITPLLIMFDPSLMQERLDSETGVLKYQVCIDICDLAACSVISVPKDISDLDGCDFADRLPYNYYLQLSSSCIDGKLEKAIKKGAQGIASVFFKLPSERQDYVVKVKKTIELIMEIAELKKEKKKTKQYSSTMIPFWDPALAMPKGGQVIKDPKNEIDDSRLSPREEEKLMERFNRNMEGESEIIDNIQMAQIVSHLPGTLRLKDWELKYCTNKHGISTQTFYRSLMDGGKTILLVKDSKGHRFGFFHGEKWRVSSRFYGSPESFLFTFQGGQRLRTFKWTQKNEMFIHSDLDSISIGSGRGIGLFLDKELLKGSSGRCDTFSTPEEGLASQKDFVAQSVEVWGFSDH
eukprot:CAMPEP_0114977048 /NCGR_PEP_ID=MMETSP0216-20121206/3017_1 /TAXON_ID=223996 /ORGANISM="Protocruzia adherens, Strain Boccale" /LENGTH=472 /DNA_ID=CAMNT_0002338055 /DNA_START=70 /DNA_END=1488 /DNA_ORIENTATION=-